MVNKYSYKVNFMFVQENKPENPFQTMTSQKIGKSLKFPNFLKLMEIL